MKILHYALGFYPYRTGGLTQYVMDIMAEQVKHGHDVGMLWPGRMRLRNHKVSVIVKRMDRIQSFEIVNPLPVPLLEGVKDITAYTAKGNIGVYRKLLEQEQPDILHVHTFMGLHEELLDAAKELGVRVVFTTHDYYALCPKVNLLCKGELCRTGMQDESCSTCDMSPLSEKKMYLMQSPLYRTIKDSALVKRMRKEYHTEVQSEADSRGNREEQILQYHKLKEKYLRMLGKMDVIHCNSTIAEEVYKKEFPNGKMTILSITNSKIVDKRKKKVYNGKDKLKITFLGSGSVYKGFFLLRDALDEVKRQLGNCFVLNVYFPVAEGRPYIQGHEPFHESELEQVMQESDVVVVPSLWKETFGFVAMEAISHGVPVLVSENVGAKDLITDWHNGVCVDAKKDAWIKILTELIQDRSKLERMNREICADSFVYDLASHVKRLLEEIYADFDYNDNL